MAQIETVVYLMLENRSLDNVLGWLYDNDRPTVVVPPGSSPDYNGLSTALSNSVNGTEYHPAVGTQGLSQPLRTPPYDPSEPMPHVLCQLYADGKHQLSDCEPCLGEKGSSGPANPPWADTPTMTGFAADYQAFYDDPAQVMGAYDNSQLPVLSGLAKNFAVSDRWFSSAPTQTDPNRAFSICGTSLGAEVNGDIDETTYAGAQTIFNALGDNGKTWGLYYQTENPLGTGEPALSWEAFTPYYFPMMKSAPNGSVESYNTFCEQATSGQLPNFCFLEPFWSVGKGIPGGTFFGLQGNDYHPPAWVGPAEADLNDLYDMLRESPQWDSMLFIISFDEHGGTYDHEPPTTSIAPDSHVGKTGFAFERLGVRVPTILVSNYVEPKTVFRSTVAGKELDHTSFIATMLKWAGVEPSSADLGARVAQAPTFEDAVSSSARTEPCPPFTVPADYRSQGGGTGTLHLGPLGEIEPTPLNWKKIRELSEAIEGAEDFMNHMGKHAKEQAEAAAQGAD